MDDNNVVAGNENSAEEVALNANENVETTTEETTESIDWEARAKKAEEIAENQKIRAEKAEKLAKGIKNPPANISSPSISTKDLYALTKANVAEEDIAEVEEYARFKKIPVAEALKSSALKAILKEKEENRNVANASNIGNTKRASSKITDEALSERASKGEMPESESDIIRLIKLRKGIK